MNKSIYERVLDLRNRISLDGDDTIYEQDHLLLDEVLDYIEINEQRAQEKTYNDTVDIYNELRIGIKFKKQEQLLELYIDLANTLEVIDKAYGYEIFEFNEIKYICNKIKELRKWNGLKRKNWKKRNR